MSNQTDYVIGMIRQLSEKHQSEMRYSMDLEAEVKRLKKKIKRLEKRLFAQK